MKNLKAVTHEIYAPRANVASKLKKTAAIAAGLASFAVPNTANASEQKPHKQTVAGVAQSIENRLTHSKAVTFDANRDVYWSDPGHKGDDFQHVTHAPLTAKVNGKERLFRIAFNKSQQPDVRPIPAKDTVQADSPQIYTPGTPQNPGFVISRIETMRDVLDVQHGANTAAADVVRADGERFMVPVGQTEHYGKSSIVA